MIERHLPHALDAEKAVLGAILVNPDAYARVGSTLQADSFFRAAHRFIFQAMTAIHERRAAIDMVTLRDELTKAGAIDECGGPAYLSSLTDGVPRTANVGSYAAIVQEKATLRGIIVAANQALVQAYDAEEPADVIMQRLDASVIDLQRTGQPGRMVDIRRRIGALVDELSERARHSDRIGGLDTGFAKLNDVTNGWQRGDMIVIAARPSMGKTAFVLNTAVAAAKTDTAVVMFSLEMRARQLEDRILASLSGVPVERIRRGWLGEFDYQRIVDAMTQLGGLPMFIDDRGRQTVRDIRLAARRIAADRPIGLLVVDYIQLMNAGEQRKGTTRNEQITDISRRLKELADELNTAVIVLSQLNRAGAQRENKRPQLEDLRDSGAIEQDADIVAFLHRQKHSESGPTLLLLDKQRNGPTAVVDLIIDRETQTFREPTPGELPYGHEEAAETAPKPAQARKPIRRVP